MVQLLTLGCEYTKLKLNNAVTRDVGRLTINVKLGIVLIGLYQVISICGHIGGGGAGASNGERRTLRVPLRLVCCMQSNRFMSNQVVTGLERLGNGYSPGVVLVDHLARTPQASREIARYQTRLADLEPYSTAWGEFGAVTVAVGHGDEHL